MPHKLGIRLTKRLGQHLLVDPHYLNKVVDSVPVDSVQQVLEVGPGTGNLTQLLIKQAAEVLAVELDPRLFQLLKSEFANQLQLFEGDILTRGQFNPNVIRLLKPIWALVANLPYNVASPVMIDALYLPNPPKFMCVTIQKEVARRLAAEPGGRDYGVLSVLIQALGDVKIITYVPPGAFLPPPKVHSAIVRILHRPDLAGRIRDLETFRTLVSRLFQHRRKTIRGGWVRMLDPDQQSRAEAALTNLQIDPGRRPETLTVLEFVNLANELTPKANRI